ncbi:hypothetical protein BH11PSE7_BH11PSE7_20110 [soil metagenome]
MKQTYQSPQVQERDELERQVEVLRREVRQLRLEQDLLNKANELLKKGLGVDLQLLPNREKTRLIDALKEHYGLPELLAQLGLARSSYFYHRARAVVGDKYLNVRQSITEIFASNHRCYGYRRLQASLTRQDLTISEKVAKHPRFVMHFTPTSASWLNMVERFFRDITDKRIRRDNFTSVAELEHAIDSYVAQHNIDPKPFIWTATASDILARSPGSGQLWPRFHDKCRTVRRTTLEACLRAAFRKTRGDS